MTIKLHKVQSLKGPLIGIFKGTVPGKYNPTVLIEIDGELEGVFGVKNVINALSKFSVGDMISINFEGTLYRDNFDEHLVKVTAFTRDEAQTLDLDDVYLDDIPF